MCKSYNPAVNIRFGESLISLFGEENQLYVHGFQKSRESTGTVYFEVARCKAEKELEKLLRSALQYNPAPWLHEPTIHIGFTNGILAIAEGLVVDEGPNLYRFLADFFVDLFGVPKYYRGKISVDGKTYDLIIYESEFVPGTDLKLIARL